MLGNAPTPLRLESTPESLTPAPEPRKRPTGLSFLCALWLLSSLVNIYLGTIRFNDDISSLYVLRTSTAGLNSTQIAALNWLRTGLPIDSAFHLASIVLGSVALYAIYGLWIGKRWSYRLALVILSVVALDWILRTPFFSSAPPILGLSDSIAFGQFVGSLIILAIFWSYLRLYHVQRFLGLIPDEAAQSEPAESDSPQIPQ